MDRFNKWTYALTMALLCGSVYFAMGYFINDETKWLNTLILASGLFITWVFLFPRFFKNQETKENSSNNSSTN
ncbi:hypothetical protein [Shouchella hunanensis]|uniref:Uncharacterized protein n=1 Tax=Shouchella hunanensis TaxID=766894 RepID=A0ABY7W640_9BACI|nr:hypothetical protein [Shouchella hunanensis]WDF02923.1 hypothetical protein PQ477_15660 [Shouchella hunanensis]